jgi:hypothetical protein
VRHTSGKAKFIPAICVLTNISYPMWMRSPSIRTSFVAVITA